MVAIIVGESIKYHSETSDHKETFINSWFPIILTLLGGGLTCINSFLIYKAQQELPEEIMIQTEIREPRVVSQTKLAELTVVPFRKQGVPPSRYKNSRPILPRINPDFLRVEDMNELNSFTQHLLYYVSFTGNVIASKNLKEVSANYVTTICTGNRGDFSKMTILKHFLQVNQNILNI